MRSKRTTQSASTPTAPANQKSNVQNLAPSPKPDHVQKIAHDFASPELPQQFAEVPNPQQFAEKAPGAAPNVPIQAEKSKSGSATLIPDAAPTESQSGSATVKPPERSSDPGTTFTRPLSDLQVTIADELADLLINGGDRHNVEMLVRCASRHTWWRWSMDSYRAEPETVRSEMLEFSGREFPALLAELTVTHRQNRKAPPEERPEPATVSQRIRESAIESLRRSFDGFLTCATPEERALLQETLVDHWSANHGSRAYDELALAKAFELQIEARGQQFVRVPDGCRGQVDALIDLYQRAERQEVAA